MKNTLALGIVIALILAACTNNPEGVFDNNEKKTQDSLDSLSTETLFDDLYQDQDTSIKQDTAVKPGDVTTENVPSTPQNSTPFQETSPHR